MLKYKGLNVAIWTQGEQLVCEEIQNIDLDIVPLT